MNMMVIDKTCSETDCHGKVKAQGRCRKHYNQWRAVRPDGEVCTKENCTSIAVVKGLCQMHYSRMLYEARRVKTCSEPGCDKALWAKGMCKAHRDKVKSNTVKPKITPIKESMGMAIEMEKIKDVLTSGDVAKICNVAARTVTKWIDKGDLEGYRIPGSLDRRVTKAALIRFMEKNKLPMYISAKRNVILFGFDADIAEITKKLVEDDLGINIHVVNDTFTAGVLVGETKASAMFVDGSNLQAIMPMLKAMDISTAEVVVAIDDPTKLKELNVNTIPSPFRVRELIAAIAKYI